tara:strand:+ start:1956 stop:2621 length:666 start_codon:yes stop_codon:yes gene_type:complete
MSNLTEWDILVNGSKQDETRKIWDFPDQITSKAYIQVTASDDKKEYYVCKNKRSQAELNSIANLLAKYQANNDRIMKNIAARKKREFTNKQNEQLNLLLKHHGKNSKKIAELNPVSNFLGMNKPYEITLQDSNHTFPIGPNIKSCTGQIYRTKPVCQLISGVVPYLRPTYRIIYVNKNQGYDNSLLVHELAHTAANHVMYRPSDHHKDFVEAEKLVKKFDF